MSLIFLLIYQNLLIDIIIYHLVNNYTLFLRMQALHIKKRYIPREKSTLLQNFHILLTVELHIFLDLITKMC